MLSALVRQHSSHSMHHTLRALQSATQAQMALLGLAPVRRFGYNDMTTSEDEDLAKQVRQSRDRPQDSHPPKKLRFETNDFGGPVFNMKQEPQLRIENIESFLNGEGSKLSPKEFDNYLIVI